MNSLNAIPVEHAVTKLTKEATNQKIIKVGDETFVCEKFICYRRMKLWHQQNHAREHINKFCTLCRSEFKIDQECKRVLEKRGPKGPWNIKRLNKMKTNID